MHKQWFQYFKKQCLSSFSLNSVYSIHIVIEGGNEVQWKKYGNLASFAKINFMSEIKFTLNMSCYVRVKNMHAMDGPWLTNLKMKFT